LPFVRLAVARYQEHGLEGKRLSPVVVCDMYKLLGRRDLEVERRSERRFHVKLSGEFDQTPPGADFPRREVVARLETRDPALSDDVVHYSPPHTKDNPAQVTTQLIAEHALPWSAASQYYAKTIEFDTERWNSAHSVHGQPSIAVLSVIEYEIFPTSELQADATGTEILVLHGRLCARRLVYSRCFALGRGEVNR
jgi:hypothetical protein